MVKTRFTTEIRTVFALAATTLVTSSCGSTLNCSILGNNVQGHVVFTSAVTESPGTNIVVEYSYSGSFAPPDGHAIIGNPQGFLAAPYSLCVTPGTGFNVRAYQDNSGDTAWQAGEGAGRDDSTQNGNATFNARKVTASTTTWNTLNGVDIFLDTTASQ